MIARINKNTVSVDVGAGVYSKVYTKGTQSMASETVRIKPTTHTKLKAIAEETGQTMPEVLDQAVELLRRQRLFDAADEAYAALKSNPKAWAKEQAEREAWDVTLSDGQEDD